MLDRNSACSRAYEHALKLHAALNQLDSASIKIENAEEYFHLSGQAQGGTQVLAQILDSTSDENLFLTGLTTDGRTTTFGASAKRSAHWQLTRFDRQGAPWGDALYPKRLQGITEFLQEIELESLKEVFSMAAQMQRERVLTCFNPRP